MREVERINGKRVRAVRWSFVETDLPGDKPVCLDAIEFEDGSRMEFTVLTTPRDYAIQGHFIPKKLA